MRRATWGDCKRRNVKDAAGDGHFVCGGMIRGLGAGEMRSAVCTGGRGGGGGGEEGGVGDSDR